MRREWTKEEVDFLEKWYETKSARYIAERLNRTEESVKRKAQRMNINTYITDSIRMKSLCRCFHVDARVIHRWIEKYNLPMKSERHNNAVMYHIQVTDFWKWAEKNKDIIPWKQYERLSLIPEPKWLSESIIECDIPRKHRNSISCTDINRVESMLHIGKSFKEIAVELERTYDSVKHIARDNGL